MSLERDRGHVRENALLTPTTAVRTGFASDVSDSIITGMTSWSRFWKSPDQGAATMLVAALDPKLSGELSICWIW